MINNELKNNSENLIKDTTKDTILFEEKDYDEIDLLDLASFLFDRIHYLILFFLVGAVILNMYSYFLVKPSYTSTAKLYVVTASDDSVINLNDLNIGTSLTSDYKELLTSYPVLDKVSAKLKLNMSDTQLSQLISLDNPSDTRILSITVTTEDPKLSADIANTLASVSCEYLPDTMSTLKPNIAQKARVSNTKSAPNCSKMTMIGGMLGFLCCAGYFTLKYLLDDTIHSAEDLEKYFGIVPLTTIVEAEDINHEENREKKSKRSLWKGKK